MPKMPGGDEKKEETAESKEEAAEQVGQLFFCFMISFFWGALFCLLFSVLYLLILLFSVSNFLNFLFSICCFLFPNSIFFFLFSVLNKNIPGEVKASCYKGEGEGEKGTLSKTERCR